MKKVVNVLNKSVLDLKSISYARNFIYGIAILWIVFYHCGLNININFFKIIKQYGDCAVEIFFFMSGCCLYFSYTKMSNPLLFYKKRLKRVLPYYLIFYGIVFIYFNLTKDFNIKQFLLNYSLLDFWINGLGNAPWFLAGIIGFYILYPFLYKLLFNKYRFKWFYITISLIITTLLSVYLSIKYVHLRIFIYRIPIFLIGTLMGKIVYENRGLKLYQLLILILFLILGYNLFNHYRDIAIYKNIYYVPLSLTIVIGLSFLFLFNQKYIGFVNKILGFIGMFTLEIYLTHEKVQENLMRILEVFNVNVEFNNTFYQLSSIIIAFLISIFLSMAIKSISKLVKRKNQN